MIHVLLKQTNFLRDLKKLSFFHSLSYSKLNHTFWINNFLDNNCFKEQLPSSKRVSDKIYSENFLKLLLITSDPHHLNNLQQFVQTKNILAVQDNVLHFIWPQFVKMTQLNISCNLVNIIPATFSFKQNSFLLAKSIYLSLLSRAKCTDFKNKNFRYRNWIDKVIILISKLPVSCFYYQTLAVKYLSSATTTLSVLFYYWFLYNPIYYNKLLFYRKLVFNYKYYFKTLIKKQTPGPFLVPYSTITFIELLNFKNSLSSTIFSRLRFSKALHPKLSLFFQFLFSIFVYKNTSLHFLTTPAAYQKVCYDYFTSNNLINSLETSENYLCSPSSKFSLILSSIYLNYSFISYRFVNKSISFFSDSFYFYFQKFTKYFLFRGNFLAAFSKTALFFYRLMRVNLVENSNSLTYFSDAFSAYLPSISLTTRSVSKGSSRSIAVPKLLKATKRIPKALQRFTFSVKHRKESVLIQRFFLEFTDLLDIRGETFRSFIDTYKAALVNLQFSQSLARSFFFEYRSRVYPTSVGKVRRRVRLENQLNYF